MCQFSDRSGRRTIADYGPFPADVYPAGRLDADSEGLVLLTNDGDLQHRLLEPRYRHSRVYLAQVERIPTAEALDRLQQGVLIESGSICRAEVECLSVPPLLWDREVPIRFRKTVPTQWLKMTIFEGRNRQVRKMAAAVGHPVLRLIRIGLATLQLGDLQPGESRSLTREEVVHLQDSLAEGKGVRRLPGVEH